MSEWLVCAMTAGPTRGYPERFLGARFLMRATELLVPGVRVAFCPRNGELVHPLPHQIEACTVGSVIKAWCTGQSILATLAISSAGVRAGLERHERAGALQRIGISVYLDPDGLASRDRPHWVDIVDAQRVLSLDLVSRPASVGCRVLRSL